MNSPLYSAATVAVAGVIDLALGEPPNALHPVAWLGRFVTLLQRWWPRGRPRLELLYGASMTVATVVAAFGTGVLLVMAVRALPLWAALPIAAGALKLTFALRDLVGAGRQVQRALADDVAAARASLPALVSRDPNLEPPLIVSATVESLAENLSDSVVAPLIFFALFGLPGAFAYRAINTMDAMIGYHGEYEYLGKAVARLDDVVNWVPARLTGLLLVVVAASRRSASAAWTAVCRQRRPSPGPNKLWTIAPMAGALGVRLEKRGAYAVGPGLRPLLPAVIGDAIVVVWAAGTATIVGTASLAALMNWVVWR